MLVVQFQLSQAETAKRYDRRALAKGESQVTSEALSSSSTASFSQEQKRRESICRLLRKLMLVAIGAIHLRRAVTAAYAIQYPLRILNAAPFLVC